VAYESSSLHDEKIAKRLGQLADNEDLVAKMVSQARADADRRLPGIQQEKHGIEGNCGAGGRTLRASWTPSHPAR